MFIHQRSNGFMAYSYLIYLNFDYLSLNNPKMFIECTTLKTINIYQFHGNVTIFTRARAQRDKQTEYETLFNNGREYKKV